MAKILKRLGIAILILFLLLWTAVTAGSVYLTMKPRPRAIEDISTLAEHPVEPVVITTEDEVTLSAWYASAGGDRAVIFLAGIDANRSSSKSRGAFFLERGFSVLLPDLRGTGKSEGSLVTIGWLERLDLMACHAFLRERGYKYIAADGVSLGAATITYALPQLPDLSFIILESSYDTLTSAVANRLAHYYTPHFIAYPFYAIFALRAKVNPVTTMRPIDFMDHAHMPTLILAGDSEMEIPIHESQSLYDRAPATVKKLYFFEGAGHWNFLNRHTEAYTEVVDSFLAQVFPPEEALD
ncbi:MAG: prolyl oligopeptidase family serine peptidase [Candidatus Hydrogenedens sp.]|nr:prolyl oligopeptidase family serine peptidase [Candidatus Hydrogenedens sp.]